MPRSAMSLPRLVNDPRLVLWLFIAFAVAVFAMGGSARDDTLSLVILRPFSIVLLGLLIMITARDELRTQLVTIALLAVLALTAVLQLLPLPPSIWTALPGRNIVEEVDKVAGIGEVWRPASLAPSKTANMLFSLAVPAAAILFFAKLGGDRRKLIVALLLAVGALHIALGILQLAGPPGSAFYTYRITNSDAPVGLLANRNHSAFFLAALIPVFTYWVVEHSLRSGQTLSGFRLVVAGGALVSVISIILIGGSRSGLLLAVASAAASIGLGFFLRTRFGNDPGNNRVGRKTIAGALFLLVAGLLAAFLATDRSLTLDRLFEGALSQDMRAKLFPILIDMTAAYFPVGSGFGTFPLVYKIIEPDSLLQTRYLNQAHNEPFQLLIEGGLPAALVLLFGLGWFAVKGMTSIKKVLSMRNFDKRVVLPLYAWLALSVLLAGGLVDYPLRTPLLMMVAALLACLLCSAPSRFAPVSK